MSKRSVMGVVCEGQTDVPILRAVLQELWPGIEVRVLQPELDQLGKSIPNQPSGWTAVREWCEQNPDLNDITNPLVGDRIDLLLIALDVDIALGAGLGPRQTPARAYDTSALCRVVKGWLQAPVPRGLVVIAIPAMAIEAWVIAAVFPREQRPESIRDPAQYLVDRRKLRSSPRDQKPWKELWKYNEFATQVARKLARVRSRCTEANRVCNTIEERRRAFENA